jgi:hypothetical protein
MLVRTLLIVVGSLCDLSRWSLKIVDRLGVRAVSEVLRSRLSDFIRIMSVDSLLVGDEPDPR